MSTRYQVSKLDTAGDAYRVPSLIDVSVDLDDIENEIWEWMQEIKEGETLTIYRFPVVTRYRVTYSNGEKNDKSVTYAEACSLASLAAEAYLPVTIAKVQVPL